LAEKYVGFSPFNYVVNNPLKYVDPDGREPEPKSTKRDAKIKEKVEKFRLKAAKQGEFLTYMEAQYKVAEKYQNKSWYRGGVVKNQKAWKKTGTTGWNLQTKMEWKVYDDIDFSFTSTAGANEDTQPFNTPINVDINESNEFKIGEMNGNISINFDDRGNSDGLTIEYETKDGTQILTKNMGSNFDNTDNTASFTIPMEDLTSTVLKVTVTNPTGSSNQNSYDLTITATGEGERNETVMRIYETGHTPKK
jgi:hypothetical protein